ncbi:MAG: hypothetical protein AB7E04_06810 [Desulfobacteraceae bacterium]
MISKLIDKETITELKELDYDCVINITGRGTGRSLGLAYKYIGEAMTNPEKPILITDHFNNINSHKGLVNTVKEVINKNGLKYLTVDFNKRTITYNIYD